MKAGQLFILEGPDGAGKSTAATMLIERLRADGIPAHLFAFPGNEPGTLGRLVYDLHHHPEAHGIYQINPTSLQVLHAAAHIDVIHTRIRPAFERGDLVIMDRFWWSTIIYGRLAGVDERTLEVLEQLARHHWAFAVPAAAFVLLGPKERSSCVSAAAQIRHAYSNFIRSFENVFPVYTFEYEKEPSLNPERILGKILDLRRSFAT